MTTTLETLALLGAATLLGVFAAPNLCGTSCTRAAQAADTPDAASVTTAQVRVDGVTCAGCVVTIRKELTALDGVTDVRSGEDIHDLSIDYDASKVTTEQLLAAITKAGYEGVLQPGNS